MFVGLGKDQKKYLIDVETGTVLIDGEELHGLIKGIKENKIYRSIFYKDDF